MSAPGEITAALLGWSAETWGAVLTAVGIVVAIAIAIAVALEARRGRTKAPPDTSGQEARRYALRADEAAGLEGKRNKRAIAGYGDSVAPRWEVGESGGHAFFASDGSELEGALCNVGSSGAEILLVMLEVAGSRVRMQTRHADGAGEWEDHPYVAPGSLLQLRCGLDGLAMGGDVRPKLRIDYEAPTLDYPAFGVTLELLRHGSDPRGRTLWRLRSSRVAVHA